MFETTVFWLTQSLCLSRHIKCLIETELLTNRVIKQSRISALPQMVLVANGCSGTLKV